MSGRLKLFVEYRAAQRIPKEWIEPEWKRASEPNEDETRGKNDLQTNVFIPILESCRVFDDLIGKS